MIIAASVFLFLILGGLELIQFLYGKYKERGHKYDY